MSFPFLDSTGVVFGPNIPLDGLSVYYDFSNSRCYPGSGNTVYDLSGNNINATLTSSNSSPLPTLTTSFPSYISFIPSSQHGMYYTLPSWGTSFTNISIYSSPVATWDGEGDIGAARWGHEGLTAIDSNGFVQQAYPAPSASTSAIEYVPVSPGYVNYTNYGQYYPPSILVPHLYFHGYNHSNGYWITGYDNIINENIFTPPLAGRATRTNTEVWFARLDPRQFGAFGARFTSVKLYLHMLYNRKLSSAEIKTIYDALKLRLI